MAFYRILFLIIVIFLLVNATFVGSPTHNSLANFFSGLSIFFITYTFFFFVLFIKKFKHEWLTFFLEISLIGALILNFFVFESQVIFFQIFPKLLAINLINIFYLTLFFLGAFLLYYWNASKSFFDKEALSSAFKQTSLFFPLTIPFLFTFMFLSIWQLIPGVSGSVFEFVVPVFVLMPLMFIFFAWFYQKAWNSHPLENEDPALFHDLEHVCKTASFRHGGLKVWTALDKVATACIIGVTPKYRYILFTKKLLQNLSPQAIGAVLAHEIGHSKKGHLFFIPAVLMGMLALGSLFGAYALPFIFSNLPYSFYNFFNLYTNTVLNILGFIAVIAIFALYFRYIFGFYLRLYEREADLYGLQIKIPSRDLIEALDAIATLNGNCHKKPCWHHYSIQERIDFLEKAEKHPSLAIKHAKKVKMWTLLYFIFFGATLVLLSLA